MWYIIVLLLFCLSVGICFIDNDCGKMNLSPFLLWPEMETYYTIPKR
jgi:hypothetical protein